MSDTDDLVTAVTAVLERHLEAFNRGDHETAFAAFSDDTEFVDALARLSSTRDGVIEHFVPLKAMRLAAIDVDVRPLGEGFAILRWSWNLTAPPEQPNGEWRLVRTGVLGWVMDGTSGTWRVRYAQNTFLPRD